MNLLLHISFTYLSFTHPELLHDTYIQFKLGKQFLWEELFSAKSKRFRQLCVCLDVQLFNNWLQILFEGWATFNHDGKKNIKIIKEISDIIMYRYSSFLTRNRGILWQGIPREENRPGKWWIDRPKKELF